MKGVVLIALGGLVLAIAAVLGPTALAGSKPKTGDERAGISRADLVGVNFVENCRYSHQAPDDPIVFPGKPGASHQHTFVGNRTTNASSSFGSLRSGSTSCMRSDDTAAYWVPAVYQGTTEILPVAATIYYRRGTLAEVSPFPNNLRVIAGDSKATAPQGMGVTFWSCGIESGVDRSADVPTCPDTRGSFLRLHIRFPECWDGRRLDSPDHKSHMAYATRAGCPSTHPIEVPQITQIYRYPSRGGEGFSLASGSVYSAHADFLNAWKPGALAQARGRLPERARPLRTRLTSPAPGGRLSGSRRALDDVYPAITGSGYRQRVPRALLLGLLVALALAMSASAGKSHTQTPDAAPVPSLEPAATTALWRSLDDPSPSFGARRDRMSAAPRGPLRRLGLAPARHEARGERDALRRLLDLGAADRRRQDAVPSRPGLAHPRARAELPRPCRGPLRNVDALGREHR